MKRRKGRDKENKGVMDTLDAAVCECVVREQHVVMRGQDLVGQACKWDDYLIEDSFKDTEMWKLTSELLVFQVLLE